MKINKRSEDVRILSFEHAGFDQCYQIIMPAKADVEYPKELVDCKVARFEFRDVEEIAMLLHGLEDFRDKILSRIRVLNKQ